MVSREAVDCKRRDSLGHDDVLDRREGVPCMACSRLFFGPKHTDLAYQIPVERRGVGNTRNPTRHHAHDRCGAAERRPDKLPSGCDRLLDDSGLCLLAQATVGRNRKMEDGGMHAERYTDAFDGGGSKVCGDYVFGWINLFMRLCMRGEGEGEGERQTISV